MNLADREMAFLRAELERNAGITLDDGPAEIAPATRQTARVVSDEEREEICEILVMAGAPDRHIAWLVSSCPSVEDAKTYQPEPKAAT